MPGVSSFCGAAAVLNAEYTLPGESDCYSFKDGGKIARTSDEDIESLHLIRLPWFCSFTTSMLEKRK